MEQPQELESESESLPGHEHVGRRLRGSAKQPHIDTQNSGVRVLIGAFFENRVGAHISVDRFWERQLTTREQAEHIATLTSICGAEGFEPLIGWAVARVDRYCRAYGICKAVASPKRDENPHHADLCKGDWLMVGASDTGKVRREKAHMLAHQMADYFNLLLQRNEAEVIYGPHSIE